MVDADELVVGAGGQISAIWRESDRVNRAQMMAHVTQLPRLPLVGARICTVDGLGRPDADVAIAAGRRESFAVGRNVAAVDFVVLLFAAVAQPSWLNDVHVGPSSWAAERIARSAWIRRRGGRCGLAEDWVEMNFGSFGLGRVANRNAPKMRIALSLARRVPSNNYAPAPLESGYRSWS